MLPHGIGVKRFEDIPRSVHLKLCTEPIASRLGPSDVAGLMGWYQTRCRGSTAKATTDS